MTRFTASSAEIKHLVEINGQVPMSGIVELKLHNDQIIEGLIIRLSVGNNAGNVGNSSPTSYYGEVTVKSEDGQISPVDFLDVKSARDVTTQRMPTFEKLDIVKIVDYPKDEK